MSGVASPTVSHAVNNPHYEPRVHAATSGDNDTQYSSGPSIVPAAAVVPVEALVTYGIRQCSSVRSI